MRWPSPSRETARYKPRLWRLIVRANKRRLPKTNRLPDLVALQGETDRNLVEQAALKGDSLAVRARLSQRRYQLLNLRDTAQTVLRQKDRVLGNRSLSMWKRG